jgi:hypothetical protein
VVNNICPSKRFEFYLSKFGIHIHPPAAQIIIRELNSWVGYSQFVSIAEFMNMCTIIASPCRWGIRFGKDPRKTFVHQKSSKLELKPPRQGTQFLKVQSKKRQNVVLILCYENQCQGESVTRDKNVRLLLFNVSNYNYKHL